MRYLADRVGIEEVYAGQTPEQKVAITREETKRAPTLFTGDGIKRCASAGDGNRRPGFRPSE